MKILGILVVLVVALVIGSFAYVAASDVPVTPTTITKDIPTDKL